jgi:threonine dehydrogenase-like Zn-dependent dehydrogenase
MKLANNMFLKSIVRGGSLTNDLGSGSYMLRTAAASLVRRYAAGIKQNDVPVAIVGAGPTGLVLSCLLSAFGESVRVARRNRRNCFI